MNTTLLLIAMLNLHPVHETVSEIEWNAQTGRLEIALRLDSLDEQWIVKRVSGRAEPVTEAIALAYLKKRYRISEPPLPGLADAKDSSTYHWIGRKQSGAHVWWFFEIEPPQGREPTWIDVSLLFDNDSSYQHRILIIGSEPQRSLTLSKSSPRSFLSPKPPQDSKS